MAAPLSLAACRTHVRFPSFRPDSLRRLGQPRRRRGAQAVPADRRPADGRAHAGGLSRARRALRRHRAGGGAGRRGRRRSCCRAFRRAGEHLLRVRRRRRAPPRCATACARCADAGAGPHDWVLVHDAARCLVTPTQIEALIAACEHDAVGGLLAHRLADTLKVASPDGRVASTLTRADKWLAQTPQMFRIGMLLDALERAGDAVTDEASAIEAHGPRAAAGAGQRAELQGHLPRGLRAGRSRAAQPARRTMTALQSPHRRGLGRPPAGGRPQADPRRRRGAAHARACWAIRMPTCCCMPSPMRCSARPGWATSAGIFRTPTRSSAAPIRSCCWPRRRAACARRLADRQRRQHRDRAGAEAGAAHRRRCASASPQALGVGVDAGQREGQDGREARARSGEGRAMEARAVVLLHR